MNTMELEKFCPLLCLLNSLLEHVVYMHSQKLEKLRSLSRDASVRECGPVTGVC